MTFEERMTAIRSELIGMMTTYVVPKHLDNDNKVRQEIEGIARMVNNKFPNDTTLDHIRGTMERAASQHAADRDRCRGSDSGESLTQVHLLSSEGFDGPAFTDRCDADEAKRQNNQDDLLVLPAAVSRRCRLGKSGGDSSGSGSNKNWEMLEEA